MRILSVYAHIIRICAYHSKKEGGRGARRPPTLPPAPALIRRAAQAALRGVSDPQECFRNALPRARACVPQGTPPDPLERFVKTTLFFEFWRLRGQKPAQNQRPGSYVKVPHVGSFFAVLSSFLLRPPKNRRFFIFFIAKGTYFTAFCGCKCP